MLSLRSSLSLVALASCFVLCASPASADSPKGDVDGDGVVSFLDLCTLQEMALGVIPPTPAGDLTGNGKVNVADVQYFLVYLLKGSKGDANGDGKINVVDLQFMLIQIQSPNPSSAADINGDGKVNVVDLLKFLKILQKVRSACK